MPNGGPDCCANCEHNVAVQKMAHPHPNKFQEFFELSHCSLRDVEINTQPFWTYCDNFGYGKKPELRDTKQEIKGYITSSGLYEDGYCRIPWHDNNPPDVEVPITCTICSKTSDKGIKIQHNSESFGFCCNRHYIEWWIKNNNSSSYNLEDYLDPNDI